MRVAHITDIHWLEHPTFRGLFFKRLMGSANLYLRGRWQHFSEKVQTALVQAVLDQEPDVLVITGDLTGQALHSEFEKARQALEPLLARIPTLMVPGNHDVYTVGSKKEARMVSYFSSWMGLEPGRAVARLDIGSLTILGLDPTRPHLLASGKLPRHHLDQLGELLNSSELDGRSILLALHYPILDRRGDLYDGLTHGLVNAGELVEVLRASRHTPSGIVHGHKHHGYRVPLHLSESRSIPIFNCGSSGYAYMPKERRAAAMNVYTVEPNAAIEVSRYLFDGGRFAPETGGAYATGR